MIKLTHRYDQNSSSLILEGVPDITCGDSEDTIGILSSWSLQIIGSPLLEGKKDHLDSLMLVILQYSRSYISGIRQSYVSPKEIVSITPFGNKHKLFLKSTQKNVKPLEIVLDDSELSDLTRCIDLLRFDRRIKLKWSFNYDIPFKKSYISNTIKSKKKYISFSYAFIIFILTTTLLYLIPINKNNMIIDSLDNKQEFSEEIN